MPITYANMRRKGATYAMARRRYPTYGRRGYAARKIQRAWRSRRRTAVANVRTGGFNNKELKFLDLAIDQLGVAFSPNMTGGLVSPSDSSFGCLTSISRGDGQNQRDGKKCFLKSVRFTGTVGRPHATDTVIGSFTMYVALVLDTQTNGALLNSEDVYSNVQTDVGQVTNMMRNLEYSSRFKVLKAKKIHIDATKVRDLTTAPAGAPEFLGPISTSTETSFQRKDFDLDWSGHIVLDYSGNSSAITNSVRNSVHLVAFSSYEGCFINGQSRVRFYD